MNNFSRFAVFAVTIAVAAITAPTAHASPDQETVFWTSIKDSSDRRDFSDYLTRYPNGVFAGIASRRLEALGAKARPVGKAAVKPIATGRGSAGRWNWDLIFDSSSQCHGIDQIKPLNVSGGKITSEFTHASDGAVFRVFGKVAAAGEVSMYATGSYAIVEMEGRLQDNAGGGRIDVRGDSVICLGEWKAWR